MTTEEIASGHFSGKALVDIHLKRARALETLLLEDIREREPDSAAGLGGTMNRDTAIAEYTHVLELDPASFDALNQRGELLAERGDIAFDDREF
ncbi:MAG: tetratricopeptide repeat protein, partial [Burkholderiales bacterium]|nr:tetratricopeptide repeat protein [Burkholderiales bacterium]